MNTQEQDILGRYSTPGLRKNQLDRSAKKDQLLGAYGRHYPRDDIDKILNQLYPPATEPQEKT